MGMHDGSCLFRQGIDDSARATRMMPTTTAWITIWKQVTAVRVYDRRIHRSCRSVGSRCRSSTSFGAVEVGDG
jgi:hypothetical protein